MPTVALLASGGLSRLDWLVLACYAGVLVVAGVWATRRRQSSTTDYFLAARRIPVWAVVVSTLATMQSAATFVGVPQDAYDRDLSYLSASLGAIVAALILARYVIPRYYALGAGTPYQLLERRFGPGAKYATSAAYLVGRVFASGSRVYVGAIPVAIAVWGDREPAHLAWAIAAFMTFGIVYTLWGGLESVIWTDVVQVCVYMGAAIAAMVLLARAIPAPWGDVVGALSAGAPGGGSKLAIVQSSGPGGAFFTGFHAPFTLLTALTGWVLLNLAAFGTDQDLVQRLLTCKSASRGARSVIGSVLIGIPAVLIFSAVGLLLWVHYTRPELMGRPTPDYAGGDSAEVFMKYIMHEMPAGAAGLMIAGVLAAGPAGINAGLNSMASTFVQDLYRPLLARGREERHYVRAGRFAVAAWGVVLGAFALACIQWQRQSGENIIQFVLGVMGFAYAGLLGVFLTAWFTRRGTSRSAVAALVAGFLVVLALQPVVLARIAGWSPWLKENLGGVVLASPWRLVLGTAAAMAVCAIPPGRGGHDDRR